MKLWLFLNCQSFTFGTRSTSDRAQPYRNWFAQHDGQIQLHGSLDLCLLARGDILAYGFRCPLHGFGGDLQTGEQFHLLTPVVEGCRRSHHSEHAAHFGGDFRFLHIQFHIGRELSLMASRTQVNMGAIAALGLER